MHLELDGIWANSGITEMIRPMLEFLQQNHGAFHGMKGRINEKG